MSNKSVASKEKKVLSNTAKICISALIIIGLDLGAIFAAVKIMEIRQSNKTPEYQSLNKQIIDQTNRLDKLEKLPLSISTVSQQVSANSNTINLISDNLNALKKEVGNNQIREIYSTLDKTGHRLDALEEERSYETLMLSVALMIKENALYHRPFVDEANILADIGKNMPQISEAIDTVLQYQNKEIVDSKELAQAYKAMAKNLSFQAMSISEPEEETTISKGLNLLKDSVSHIKLDRVIVLKKQKKTEEQNKLLNTLASLVDNYKFAEAIEYINNNDEFKKIVNSDFVEWQQNVKNSVTFNQALTQIIQAQLKAIRQDVKSGHLIKPEVKANTQEIAPSEKDTSATTEETNDAEILE